MDKPHVRRVSISHFLWLPLDADLPTVLESHLRVVAENCRTHGIALVGGQTKLGSWTDLTWEQVDRELHPEQDALTPRDESDAA
jgi:hypothetical protein